MRTVFADSFYFFALLSKSDEAHAKAVDFTQSYGGAFLTTEWVLTEVGDGLASTPQGRAQFLRLREELTASPRARIVAFDDLLHQAGLTLYAQRPDKTWPLTDCISFVVMHQAGLTEALTADHHFEQVGFAALLK